MKNYFSKQIGLGILLVIFSGFTDSAVAEVQILPASDVYLKAIETPPSGQGIAKEAYPSDGWGFYGQATVVGQYHPTLNSLYQGSTSLTPGEDSQETTDVTLYAGVRILGGEFWVNPEIDQGFGLSNSLGIAGFSSGEAYKVGANNPYYRLPRVFYRNVINLGGEEQNIVPSANRLGRIQTSNNLILTIGKFSVTDIFDGNAYAHDPRTDFLNWSIIESGAFDYASDVWGFTDGASVEWTQSRWTLRCGFFGLSSVPDSATIDTTFKQHEWVGEIEERYQLWEHPGKLKLLSFINQGNMGSYADAVQLGTQTNSIPDNAQVRHFASRSGFAINIEQDLAADLGFFARLSKNDGSKETFEFTEINQSVAAGVSIKGNRWGHHEDTVGLAGVVNGLSGNAIAYFKAGGMGVIIGDGKLTYGMEQILEAYYTYAVPGIDHLMLTLNYQHVINPGYNEDRGPVNIMGVRVHKEF